MTAPLTRWHAAMAGRDAAALPHLIAPDAVFRSPAVFAPQEGKALVTAYLTAAMTVLGERLRYQREWVDGDSAVLEFVSEIDGREIHGVDMITWDDHGLIVDFTVMVRPLSALQALMPRMADELTRLREG